MSADSGTTVFTDPLLYGGPACTRCVTVLNRVFYTDPVEPNLESYARALFPRKPYSYRRTSSPSVAKTPYIVGRERYTFECRVPSVIAALMDRISQVDVYFIFFYLTLFKNVSSVEHCTVVQRVFRTNAIIRFNVSILEETPRVTKI